jgi:Protein of unknown function (DUF2815)
MASLEKLKEGKNFIVYKSGDQKLIKIENIRFSYPHFGAQREDEDENGKKKLSWGGVAMLPKSTHVEAKDAFVALMNEIMLANDVKVPPEYRCIKNGDDKEDELMSGHWLISFSDSKKRPSVRDKQGGLVLDEAKIDDMIYGGCWGSVLLRPWYFNGKAKNSTKTFPKRICCGFTGVQFLRDDTPFGTGRIDDTDAWGEGGSESGDSLDDEGL